MDVSPSPQKQLVQQFVRNTDEISSKTWAFDHTPGSVMRFENINDFHCHYLGVSENRGTPKWMVKRWKTSSKWMIWGYHYFRKHPSSWWFFTTEPKTPHWENKRTCQLAVKWGVCIPELEEKPTTTHLSKKR